jgi:acetyltransferase-like isoleucine patch superfamily enzyme
MRGMKVHTALASITDERGNQIVYNGPTKNVKVTFRGSNNKLVISDTANLGTFGVQFDCDNGYAEIGPSAGVPSLTAWLRVGQDAKIIIGENVSSTSDVYISAVEGVTVSIGKDVMLAGAIEIRADDGHAIFDVKSGLRVNPSKPISIGNHVWVGAKVTLLGGATIGDGSVIGLGSIVKGKIPNNCIAAGVPAKVIRRNTAWERPHLSLTRPFYKPDASTVTKSPYWNMTEIEEPPIPAARSFVGRALNMLRP